MTTSAADAAQRWRATWEDAWPRHDIEAIVALYSRSAQYRALPFRESDRGVDGVRRYLRETFGAETDVVCRFGEPVVSGDRAAVEWWASWVEEGEPVTLAGTTVLRFDEEGLVLDHRDYWNQLDRRIAPFDGW